MNTSLKNENRVFLLKIINLMIMS